MARLIPDAPPRMHSVILLLPILLFLPTPCFSGDVLNDVQAMISAFGSMTAPFSELLPELAADLLIAPKFLGVLGPIASLAATVMHFYVKPESSEYKAIVKLHSFVAESFSSLSAQIDNIGNELNHMLILNDYNIQITLRANLIEETFKAVIDPLKNRTQWRPKFVRLCTESDAPLKALEWINIVVNERCSDPTREEARIFSLSAGLFREIEQHIIQFNRFAPGFEQYKNAKNRLIGLLTQLPDNLANTTMEKIRERVFYDEESVYATPLNLVHLINSFVADITSKSNETTCILRSTLHGNDYRRQPLDTIASMLRFDTVKLALIAGVCANISHESEPDIVRAELGRIGSILVTTFTKMGDWIAKALALAWPDVIREAAVAAIGLSEVTKYQYGEAAERVRWALNERGPSTVYHNTIVSWKWETMYNFWAPCDIQNCLKIENYKTINIVIAKFQRSDAFERLEQASNWLNATQNNMTLIIKKELDADTGADLGQILWQINSTLGHIEDPSLFLQVVFLRYNKYWASECVIDYGIGNSFVRAQRKLN